MGLQKFRVGEGIEIEYTLYTNKVDGNGDQIPVNLADAVLLNVDANLYYLRGSRKVLLRTYNTTAADGDGLMVYKTPDADGVVSMAIDPVFCEGLEPGQYEVEFVVKYNTSTNLLFPDQYNLKPLLNPIKFELV